MTIGVVLVRATNVWRWRERSCQRGVNRLPPDVSVAPENGKNPELSGGKGVASESEEKKGLN